MDEMVVAGQRCRRSAAALFLVALVMLLLMGAALGEEARVVTPGGKLNVRKSPDEKSKLVQQIPNHAMVEVLSREEDWVEIRYKKKTGFVQRDYVKLPEDLVSRGRFYPDEGYVLLYEAESTDAPVCGIVGPMETVTIVSYQSGWVLCGSGDMVGFAPSQAFSYQRKERPEGSGMLPYVTLEGTVKNMPEESGDLSAGTRVRVTLSDGDSCLCFYKTEGRWKGVELPKSSVVLDGLLDEEDEQLPEGIGMQDLADASAKALKKLRQFSTDAKKLYHIVTLREGMDGLEGQVALVGYLDDDDHLNYLCAVECDGMRAVYVADVRAFADGAGGESFLPEGTLEIHASTGTVPVGGVVDITVDAWDTQHISYALLKDGKSLTETEPGSHVQASWRPKAEGDYTLRVQAEDESGNKAVKTLEILVTAQDAVSQEEIYSQKDGWWKDKAYRRSDLDTSGCAIFTLSHALHLMGITGEDTLPENLARTYALCLTVDGTNNERLITTAGKDYGFTTRSTLYENQKQIAQLLEDGCLFSFSVARGHIALVAGVSQDHTMVRIVDSAPGATFERVQSTSLYIQTKSGSFRAVKGLEMIPGARWYFTEDNWGGLTYWMPLKYVAARGVRLIRPADEE